MTEKEKMLAGALYDSSDPELAAERAHAKTVCGEYNAAPYTAQEKRKAMMRALLGKTGENFHIESDVWFDYGYNTEIGENFYCNHDCVFLDCAKITFGNDVFIGPQCGFYTAGHPLDKDVRRKAEFAEPITVGSDVWIGGGVKIMPGVTVGDNVVIGGGAVVTRDIPPDSVAVGNPAKVVKKLTKKGGER